MDECLLASDLFDFPSPLDARWLIGTWHGCRSWVSVTTTIVNIHQSVVWIDRLEARILRAESQSVLHVSTIHAQRPEQQSDKTEEPQALADEDGGYFHRVARALDVADEILVAGPSPTAAEFVTYMNKNDHAIDPRIVGVETVDKPSDARLARYAKLYFKWRDPGPGNGNGFS
jgi:hypothetical protein